MPVFLADSVVARYKAYKVDRDNQLSWFPGFSHVKVHFKLQYTIPGDVGTAKALQRFMLGTG